MPRRKKGSHENQSRLSINKEKPQQRYAANARERARMRVLSRAFCRLKTTLPWVPADTKLSKLDTLRLAASYIAHLKGILRDETLGSSESSLHPAMSLTWPFGFNRPLGGSTGGENAEGGSILASDEDDDEDDEDPDDVEDEDGESISSCTGWEDVSPPAKECVHLDSRRKGRARVASNGKPSKEGRNNVNTRQVGSKKEISSSSSASTPSSDLNKHNVNININSENGSQNNNTIASAVTTIRPLSQSQHHHHHPHHESHHHHHSQDQQQHHHVHNGELIFPHFESDKQQHLNSISSVSTLMAVTNSENAPPHLHSTTPQNEILVGVGNPISALDNNTNDSFLADINGGSFTQQLSHNINHGGNNDMHHQHHHHHQVPQFGFGNSDLISIG